MCGRRQAFQNKVYITNVVVDAKGSFMANLNVWVAYVIN